MRQSLGSAISVFGWIWLFSAPTLAAPIDVSITTDKSTYMPGEALHFHVTAHNRTDQDITLHFGSTLQAQYAIDGDSFVPDGGYTMLTQRTIPGNGFYTWTYRHHWFEDSLAFGAHSVVGRIVHEAPTLPATFEVVHPAFPTEDFSLDFETLPGTDTPIKSLDETWPYGVRFRSESARDSRPGTYTSNDGTNTYVGVMSTTYPPGFNIIADFDMPVHGATVNVSSATGVAVTMIARDREGQLLASVTSDPIPAVGDFTESLSIQSAAEIASLEWRPSRENASVMIDNLAIALPEPCMLPVTLGVAGLLARPRRLRG